MKAKAVILNLAICLISTSSYCLDHEIIFCGEKIPVDDHFVADKLMNIIRKQINYVNLPELRQRANKYFNIVEYYLKATGLPEDFKYLAIVESGFTTAVSKVGAAGFWQIMPATARDWGLTMNEYVDERNNIYKSTHAACKELARNYLYIRKNYGISSWVLAAAAYNHGVGNIEKAIKHQGKNYFQMNLNAETATYVYKIIAVKELFEYPELYMKNFGYNVFNTVSPKLPTQEDLPDVSDASTFSSMTLKVDENDGNHPDRLDTANVEFDRTKVENYLPDKKMRFGKVKFIYAQIIGKYKDFKDGDLVSFELNNDLQVGNSFVGKGTIIQWQGWKIDDRIFIDLGFDHNVILYDLLNTHGVSFSTLKKKEKVIIMVNTVEG
ncbi:MAG: lytic transglycosylase domain-containing protein [Ginsengibacter sp.]